MDFLDASQDDLERFFEMALDHLVVAGFDGYFKRVSRAWTVTLGWSEEELLARRVIDFVHPEDRATVLADRDGLKRGVPLIGRQNRYQHKDGSYRWFEWRSVGYPERELVYAVARDVTEQRRLLEERQRVQAQLIVSERMASVGRLARGVAHEINNPLSYVTANLRMAIEEVSLAGAPDPSHRMEPGELAEMLGDALEGAERVTRVVKALQALAAADGRQPELMDLQEPIGLALSMVSRDVRSRARIVESHRSAPPVFGDRSKLCQALVNLLLNAAEAIPPGEPESNDVRIATFTDGRGRAVVEIQDTGVGIPEALRGRLFEPFVSQPSASGKGPGLGLSICRTIVHDLGGEIDFEPAPERGTIFRITLPPAERDA